MKAVTLFSGAMFFMAALLAPTYDELVASYDVAIDKVQHGFSKRHYGAQINIAVQQLKLLQAKAPKAQSALTGADVRLTAIINAVDFMVLVHDTVPRPPRKKKKDAFDLLKHVQQIFNPFRSPEAAKQCRKALAEAIRAIGSSKMQEKAEALDQKFRAYQDATTYDLATSVVQILNNRPNKTEPKDNEWIMKGYSRYVKPSRMEWIRYTHGVDELNKELATLGNVRDMQAASPERRRIFAMKHGGVVDVITRRAAMLQLFRDIFTVCSVLLNKVVRSGQERLTFITPVQGLKRTIDEISVFVTAPEERLPTMRRIQRWQRQFTEYDQKHADEILTEIAAIESRIQIFVDIASMMTGTYAFQGTMKVLGGVKLLNGGKGIIGGTQTVLRFSLGSLAFTSASTGSRMVLTNNYDITAKQFLQQALTDAATLGLVHGARHIVGKRLLSKPPKVKAIGEHTATFTAIWGLGVGMELYHNGPDGKGFLGYLKTIAKVGIKSATNLVLFSAGMKLSKLAMLKPAAMRAHLRQQSLMSSWNSFSARAHKVGTKMTKLAKKNPKGDTSKRDAQIEKLTKEAIQLHKELASIVRDMKTANMLKAGEASAIISELTAQRNVLVNLRDSVRLGIRSVSNTLSEFSGRSRNVHDYLLRLKSQGDVTSVSKVGRKGAVKARYSDGTTRWYIPRGRGRKAVHVDMVAETVNRVGSSVPKAVRSAALKNLRKLPSGELQKLTAGLKDGAGTEHMLRWAAKPGVAKLFQQQNSVFNSEFLLRLAQTKPGSNSAVRDMVEKTPLDTLARWGATKFETAVPGRSRSINGLQTFLGELKLYRGTTDISSPAAAKQVIRDLKGLHNAGHAENPARIVASMRARGSRTVFWREALRAKGYKGQKFRVVKIDGMQWVVMFSKTGGTGSPVRAFRTPKGHKPDYQINVRKHLDDIRRDLGALDTGKLSAAQLTKVTARLKGNAHRLALLRRMGGVERAEVTRLLDRARLATPKPKPKPKPRQPRRQPKPKPKTPKHKPLQPKPKPKPNKPPRKPTKPRDKQPDTVRNPPRLASRLTPKRMSQLARMSNRRRIKEASKVLKMTLSKAQGKAVIAAHKSGKGELGADNINPAGYYNWKLSQLWAKYKILRAAGFDKAQIKVLFREGITGTPSRSVRYINAKLIGRRGQQQLAVMELKGGTKFTKAEMAVMEKLTLAINTRNFKKITDADLRLYRDRIAPRFAKGDAKLVTVEKPSLPRDVKAYLRGSKWWKGGSGNRALDKFTAEFIATYRGLSYLSPNKLKDVWIIKDSIRGIIRASSAFDTPQLQAGWNALQKWLINVRQGKVGAQHRPTANELEAISRLIKATELHHMLTEKSHSIVDAHQQSYTSLFNTLLKGAGFAKGVHDPINFVMAYGHAGGHSYLLHEGLYYQLAKVAKPYGYDVTTKQFKAPLKGKQLAALNKKFTTLLTRFHTRYQDPAYYLHWLSRGELRGSRRFLWKTSIAPGGGGGGGGTAKPVDMLPPGLRKRIQKLP